MPKRKKAAAKKTKTDAKPTRLSDKLDRDLVARAIRKAMSRETLTSMEKTALRRHEKEQEEQRRWQYYEAIPQKHWRQMSGRQTKILHEQALAYGIPFGDAVINLPRVVRGLHDFLSRNARKLADKGDEDLFGGEVSSPALERYREERAKLAQLDRLEREKVLVSRDQMREGLGRVAAILRQAGEALNRQHGEDAVQILNDALDDADREIGQLFGDEDDSGDTSQTKRT